MAVLTLIAMGLWYAGWHGSQATESLKWLQFLQTMGTFLLPPVLCAWLWSENHRPFQWLKLDAVPDGKIIGLAIAVMVCAIPGINLLADLNGRIQLPESLASIEQMLKQQEELAAALTERFLQADHIGGLLVNVGLMALLPALAEELTFRGTLQQLMDKPSAYGTQLSVKTHIAIWVTAIVFSAIHMQFYGFVPRMLMGAMFGYLFVWTGSLWVPVVMHFVNNGMAVVAYYVTAVSYQPSAISEKNIADTIGAGDTWWLGVLSLIAVGVLLWLLRRMITSPGQPECDRRTHKQ
jgi:hypothetical protein